MKKIVNKFLIFLILSLTTLIISKYNSDFRDKIYYYLYEDNLSFMKIKQFYNKYLGGIYFFDNKPTTYMTFNSKLSYTNLEKYNDGIKLTVTDNYLVPNLETGIVTFVGLKEDYGNTIIIQTTNNINIWYCNLKNISIKLYDYVEKGTYLGESENNYIYILYSKENKFLDYTNYFKY